MSAHLNRPAKELLEEDKENMVVEKNTKGGKNDLREMTEWHNTQGILEEDQLEEDLLSKKRNMKPKSVQNFSINLVKC